LSRLRIGIACYPSFGGSGIVATELGMELGRRGHEVHFICSDRPRRFVPHAPTIHLHEVKPPGYPLFKGDSQYALALTSRLVEVAQEASLDIFHVHYAIPHAVAGALAREILGDKAPRLMTTLHGTDITVVGSDPYFLPVTRFAIERSQGLTTPSSALRSETFEKLGIDPRTEIEVIPNFVDTEEFTPAPAGAEPALVVHNSNFRPLKRVGDVLGVFALLRKTRRCELALIGDGPDRPAMERLAQELGIASSVTFLGERLDFADVLRRARVFLLPSAAESFGLAALEALSCGVPVVASRVGGLPEVVDDGVTGFLRPAGDIEAMAEAAGRVLDDGALRTRMSVAARAVAVERFRLAPAVDRYEAYYQRVLAR
jgi:N-acetyl-alpha-D-glucosaminyl L-malate synthase BshA